MPGDAHWIGYLRPVRTTCSFCGDTEVPDEAIVMGPGHTAICADCVDSAVTILEERRANMPSEFVLGGVGQLITNDPRRPDLLGEIRNAAIHVRGDRIVWLGPDAQRPRNAGPVLECRGRMVIPGFVDPHAAPLMPKADAVTLRRDTTRRVGAMITHGTAALGLVCRASDPPLTNMRLSTAHLVGRELPVDVVLIHEMPPDVSGSALLDGVRMSAASAVFDISHDGDVTARILGELGRLGQRTRVHGGGSLGARLAIESSSLCWVADRPPSDAMAEALIGADVVVVPESDAGAWWDGGVVVALATHHQAGAGRVVSMQWAIGDAVRNGGMPPDAALWAATRGGAVALDRRSRGVVAVGGRADLIVVDAETPSDLSAQPDVNLIHRLVMGGEITDMTGFSAGFA
ncbi:MAG: amidohydrolase family protein [Acidimicrobiia bacterium]|nr:amidohydrolase family protein [Acidimicrobiia bacterium]